MFVLLFQVFVTAVLTLIACVVIGYFLFLSDSPPAADLNPNHLPSNSVKGENVTLGSVSNGSSSTDLKDRFNNYGTRPLDSHATRDEEALTSEVLLRGGGRAVVTLVDGICHTQESAQWVNDVLRWVATVGIMCATQSGSNMAENKKKNERIPMTRMSSISNSVSPVVTLGVGDEAQHQGPRTIKSHVYIGSFLVKVTKMVREKINSKTFSLELKSLRHGSELVNIGVLRDTEAEAINKKSLKQKDISRLSLKNKLSLVPLPRLTGNIVSNFTCLPHGQMTPHESLAGIHINDKEKVLNAEGRNKNYTKAQGQYLQQHPLGISRLLSPSKGVYLTIPIVFSDPNLDMTVSGTFPLMINKFVNTQLLLSPDMLSIAGEVSMSNLTFTCEVRVRIKLRSVFEGKNSKEKRNITRDERKRRNSLTASQECHHESSDTVVRKSTVLDITFPSIPHISCHLETSLGGSDGRQGKIPSLRQSNGSRNRLYPTTGEGKDETVSDTTLAVSNASPTPFVLDTCPSFTTRHSSATNGDRFPRVVGESDTFIGVGGIDDRTQNPMPSIEGQSTRNHNVSYPISADIASPYTDDLTIDCDKGAEETVLNDINTVSSPVVSKDDKLTEIVRIQLQRATKALVFPNALQIIIGGDEQHLCVGEGVESDKPLPTEASKGLSLNLVGDSAELKGLKLKKALKMQFSSVKMSVVTLRDPW